MIRFRQLLIRRFVRELKKAYKQTYSLMEPHYGNIIEWTGRLALENIANTDALYHDIEHTIMVTMVGQSILKGKHLIDGGVTPSDWLHVTMALLCHDIGYIKGVCRADEACVFATGVGNGRVELPDDGTDAALTPYHVDRSKLFVHERFDEKTLLDFVDAELVASYIEMTRFPVPEGDRYKETGTFGGLVRAADFIGQLGDPNYLRKIPALFYEFMEVGNTGSGGYESPGQMRNNFTKFYWEVVYPFIPDALRYLNVTQEGKQWIANLYAHLHKVEHGTAC
jgi:hypothetical protein